MSGQSVESLEWSQTRETLGRWRRKVIINGTVWTNGLGDLDFAAPGWLYLLIMDLLPTCMLVDVEACLLAMSNSDL